MSTDSNPWPRWQALAEVAAIFALFFIQGSWPAPEVNETYYLGKACHCWNPDWIAHDFFLQTADTHKVFYLALGWATKFLSLPAFAWCGRVLAWLLLAWSWRRLSVAVVPRKWFAVLTAGLLVVLNARCHMAGEWIIGGLEAKDFAFVLVLLALEGALRGFWNRAWLLVGAAAAFHVLVGGWAALALGCGWLAIGRGRPALRGMAPWMLGGFLLTLPGLLPALAQDWGVPSDVAEQAHQLYVYQRFPHHLDPWQIPPHFILRFLLTVAVWCGLCWSVRSRRLLRPLCGFVNGALAIALFGATASCLEFWKPALAAGLLRFYCFRLADVAVPVGIALVGTLLLVRAWAIKRWLGWACTLLAVVAVGTQMGDRLRQWNWPPRSLEFEFPAHRQWIAACRWIDTSGKIPHDACFITPRQSETFKWYAGRAEVVNWKETPQDARSIMQWWQRLRDLYGSGSDDPSQQWFFSMADQTPEHIRVLARKYHADYILMYNDPRLPLPVLYENDVYVVYRITDSP